MVEVEERIRVRQSLAETALALALYRVDRGEFPKSLDALVPAYIDTYPLDTFDGQPIRYRRRDEGYVLYSVDADGRDNNGLRPGAWQLARDSSSEHDVVFESPPLIQPE